jgi:hypothetical protein
MGTTTRFALAYPASTDEPNGPVQIQALADDVEDQLARAFPCTSGTRPTGIGDGFLIWETDTKLLLAYDLATTTWTGVGSGSGGGGGGSTAGGTWTAGTSAQSIPNAANTIVAFGTAVGSPTGVTRAASGAGHKFTLGSSGVWAVHATLRYASAAAGGVRDVGVWANATTNLAHSGSAVAGQPATHSLGTVRYLASGTEITVIAYQATGAARVLEPNSGAWVHIDIALVA